MLISSIKFSKFIYEWTNPKMWFWFKKNKFESREKWNKIKKETGDKFISPAGRISFLINK